MPDVHIKVSDGVHEVSVDITGGDSDPITRAEETAMRLLRAAVDTASPNRRIGFSNWALSSDTERSPEE